MLLLGRTIVAGTGVNDAQRIDVDCYERIAACLRVLASPTAATTYGARERDGVTNRS
jgi:hypothetical protein